MNCIGKFILGIKFKMLRKVKEKKLYLKNKILVRQNIFLFYYNILSDYNLASNLLMGLERLTYFIIDLI